MSNYCAMPFNHTTIGTDGTFQVCCWHFTPPEHIVNINTSPYEVWKQSPYLKEVQESFKNNQPHPGCHKCWETEKANQTSLRKRTAKDYQLMKATGTTPSDSPIDIEIQLGNLCNLKCIMCHEASSSAILAENQKLGIAKYSQKDFAWTPDAYKNLEKLIATRPKIINVRGGEPLYNKDLLSIIENFPDDIFKNTLLHITTNATQWSDRWQKALSKFRVVRVMLSIDAVGELYEYIRFPASWKEVDDNIQEMQSMPSLKLMVNSVVQNLNISTIGDLVAWANQRNLFISFSQLLVPEYLRYTNLLPEHNQKAIEHLRSLLDQPLEPSTKTFLTTCYNHLLVNNFDPILWQKFVDNISLRDNIRGNSYKKFL